MYYFLYFLLLFQVLHLYFYLLFLLFLKLNTTTPFPIILDGVIQKDTLKYLKKNEKWVYELLEKERVVLQDVFYAFYKNKKTFIIKQSEVNSIE